MWNPFKKKEQEILGTIPASETSYGTGVKLANGDIAIRYGSPRIESKLPKLTKTELLALESCINFATKGCKTVQVEPILRPAYALKGLTDKGYLVRVKKGHYQLSFIK
jgi:hypothetical protein